MVNRGGFLVRAAVKHEFGEDIYELKVVEMKRPKRWMLHFTETCDETKAAPDLIEQMAGHRTPRVTTRDMGEIGPFKDPESALLVAERIAFALTIGSALESNWSIEESSETIGGMVGRAKEAVDTAMRYLGVLGTDIPAPPV